MAKRSVQEVKEQLQKIKSITPWEEVEINTVYHIPPVISLERREIVFLSKGENEGIYKRIDVDDDKEGKMHKTSVFARFLIKKKGF